MLPTSDILSNKWINGGEASWWKATNNGDRPGKEESGGHAPAVNGPEGFSDYPFKLISLPLIAVSGWVCEFASKDKSWMKGVEIEYVYHINVSALAELDVLKVTISLGSKAYSESNWLAI